MPPIPTVIPTYEATVVPVEAIEEPDIKRFCLVLGLALAMLFLWPITVFVEVDSSTLAGPSRKGIKNTNETEEVTEEMFAEVTEATEVTEAAEDDSTTVIPRLVYRNRIMIKENALPSRILSVLDPAQPLQCHGQILCKMEELAATWRHELFMPRSSR